MSSRPPFGARLLIVSRRYLAAAFLLGVVSAPVVQAGPRASKPGFVLHFDFIENAAEGLALVDVAARTGAQVINLVPPAHIWDSPVSVAALDKILAEISRRHLSLLITRIDASQLPDPAGNRFNYLYGRILTEPGRMPNGKETGNYFLTTAGRDGYAEWMEEETGYYARRYGKLANLLGINLGPFSEPDTAQRCGFFEYEFETKRYELTQYTRSAEVLWHNRLAARLKDMDALNREYVSDFRSFETVPLPLNENDSRFGRPDLAYFDFARALSDWFVERYQRCRSIWHEVSGRADVPFILQFSGGAAEKFLLGRPGFAAFDLPGWVAMSDALGMSLYTNSGFADMGHASIIATLRLIALARDLGKDIFVLEGGNEAPNVTLDPVQIAFFGSVAAPLAPRTYVYEFLKDKFAEEYDSNPGKLVAADGSIRKPAFDALRKLFGEIRSRRAIPEKPAVYFVFDSATARGNAHAGELNAAMYDLASSVAVRWVPKGYETVIRAGAPVVRVDGVTGEPTGALQALMNRVPPIDAFERADWRAQVVKLLTR
jgi:hypothetical protein